MEEDASQFVQSESEKEEGLFKSLNISCGKVPDVLSGEAVLWDLGLQGSQ